MCCRIYFAIALALAIAACGNRAGISNLRSEISEAGTGNSNLATSEAININTASSEELQRLPHIGASMAQKIIEHREKHGPFKRPEQLMTIAGISDVRYRRIRHLIRVK
jgi:competence protein ComEA